MRPVGVLSVIACLQQLRIFCLCGRIECHATSGASYSAVASLDGDVGVRVFPEDAKSSDDLRYCGSPTLRTSSAKRRSERRGSSKKSVFNPSSDESRS
jgi:hypothetical protein